MACESSESTAAFAGQQPPPLKRATGLCRCIGLHLHWCMLGSMGSAPPSFLTIAFNYFKAKGIVLALKKKIGKEI